MMVYKVFSGMSENLKSVVVRDRDQCIMYKEGIKNYSCDGLMREGYYPLVFNSLECARAYTHTIIGDFEFLSIWRVKIGPWKPLPRPKLLYFGTITQVYSNESWPVGSSMVEWVKPVRLILDYSWRR